MLHIDHRTGKITRNDKHISDAELERLRKGALERHTISMEHPSDEDIAEMERRMLERDPDGRLADEAYVRASKARGLEGGSIS